MSGLRLTHIGGPTVLIEVDGWRLLTDPTFDPPGRRYSFGWGASSRKLSGLQSRSSPLREATARAGSAYDGVREVAGQVQVDVALLHLGSVQFPVTGPLRYTLTAREGIELCRLIRPRRVIPAFAGFRWALPRKLTNWAKDRLALTDMR